VFCEVSFDVTARTVCVLVYAGNEPELTQTPFRSEGEKRYIKGNGDGHCRRNCEIGGIVRLVFSRVVTVNIIVFWYVNPL